MKHLLISLFLFLSAFFPQKVLANSDYATSLTATYALDKDGVANVKQEITIENLQPNIYATEYEIDIASNRLKNISAKTNDGKVIPFISEVIDNTTRIHLNFADKIVGKGKKRVFTLSFQNKDAAQKVGQTLEINIPKLASPDVIDNYAVNLQVPSEFGQPSIVSPSNYNLKTDPLVYVLSFTNENIKNTSITAIFGDNQIFAATLNYHLENPTITPVITQIALPPDTAYQKVYYDSLEPLPQKIEADADGNWIATYQLEPKAQVNVVAKLKAVVYLKPTVAIPPPKDFKAYTTPQKFWEVSDAAVQKLAQELKTPQNIYNYLVTNFNYNYQRLNNRGTDRLGASASLKNPDNTLCQEFTDTFIAIARAANIPARANNGFAFTDNPQLKPLSLVTDLLHAWPEYYDDTIKAWRPIDPTWGNTTGNIDYFNHLDLNHLVFSITGINSDKPLPAGYYKPKDNPTKDVEVTLIPTYPQVNIKYHQALNLKPTIPFIGGHPLTLTFQNLSNTAFYNPPFKTFINNDPNTAVNHQLHSLLPFESVTLELKFNSPIKSITTNLYEQSDTQTISQTSINTLTSAAIAPILVTACFIFALIFWRVLVSKPKK